MVIDKLELSEKHSIRGLITLAGSRPRVFYGTTSVSNAPFTMWRLLFNLACGGFKKHFTVYMGIKINNCKSLNHHFAHHKVYPLGVPSMARVEIYSDYLKGASPSFARRVAY
jgi:hypothetical protein